MTRNEFTREMQRIEEKYKDDPETKHKQMDILMEETLIELGYREGIEIFRKALRFYA